MFECFDGRTRLTGKARYPATCHPRMRRVWIECQGTFNGTRGGGPFSRETAVRAVRSDGLRRRGTDGLQTLRWREMDSNFRFRVRCKRGLRRKSPASAACRRRLSAAAVGGHQLRRKAKSRNRTLIARNRKFESISLPSPRTIGSCPTLQVRRRFPDSFPLLHGHEFGHRAIEHGSIRKLGTSSKAMIIESRC